MIMNFPSIRFFITLIVKIICGHVSYNSGYLFGFIAHCFNNTDLSKDKDLSICSLLYLCSLKSFLVATLLRVLLQNTSALDEHGYYKKLIK